MPSSRTARGLVARPVCPHAHHARLLFVESAATAETDFLGRPPAFCPSIWRVIVCDVGSSLELLGRCSPPLFPLQATAFCNTRACGPALGSMAATGMAGRGARRRIVLRGLRWPLAHVYDPHTRARRPRTAVPPGADVSAGAGVGDARDGWACLLAAVRWRRLRSARRTSTSTLSSRRCL